jgi:alkyl sulfatase BDS1-like metallo-beta-lactamase superfamily hydrolase
MHMNHWGRAAAGALIVWLTGAVAAPGQQCPGDCNADSEVTIDELVAAVNAALGGCGAAAGAEPRTCGPRGIITEPDVFLPSPDAATTISRGLLQINAAIYQASGFSNTFMVVTSAGNVIIDTSIVLTAAAHKAALQAIDSGAVKYIILTHAHTDHIGGVGLWKQEGTKVIAQRNQVDFLHYENRMAALFRRRNLAQFSLLLGVTELPPYADPDAPVENFGGEPVATDFFDEFYEFRLGGLTFQMLHTPGETPDHLTVWIPEYKIAFSGDNYYLSFPNLYTLRGTEPRKALEYVRSLDTVLSWNPEILAPSHGDPLYGRAHIQETVGKYRDAIQYVHDETVQGLNAGKDAYTLMREIELPPELAQSEVYGNIPWSVRGIYEGYIGWFDGNVSNMYETPARSIHAELVERAGGADAIAARAAELVEQGDAKRALHMADVALEADPRNVTALQAKRRAVDRIFNATFNLNELGWLNAARIELDARLAAAEASP